MSRNRLTDQAITNVKAVNRAQLEKVSGGYRVHLIKEQTSILLNDRMDRPVVYPSKDSAKRALGRHNDEINISLKPQI